MTGADKLFVTQHTIWGYDSSPLPWSDHIPIDIQERFEIHEVHHASAILATELSEEFEEICQALREFNVSPQDIVEPGRNESSIPRKISSILRPLGWTERVLTARWVVDESEVGEDGDEVEVTHDTHKVDYIKGRVAFDLEWNSKDQTFDRDLYAFRAFFDYGRISVAVLLTRSQQLNPYFESLGNYILDNPGRPTRDRRTVSSKYGASTTHMGKLLPRLRAGRNGGCPVLVFGITPKVLDIGWDFA